MMGSGHRGSRMGKEWLSFPHQPAEGNKHSTHSMSLKFLRKVKGGEGRGGMLGLMGEGSESYPLEDSHFV